MAPSAIALGKGDAHLIGLAQAIAASGKPAITRVRFISFLNGPAGGPFDIGTKPRSRAAYRRFVVPLTR